MPYAQETTVTPEKSQSEIQRTLRRYGAAKFGVMEDEKWAHVMFQFNNLMIQMSVPLPLMEEFLVSPGGRRRSNTAKVAAVRDKAIRQRWRALLLAIKAKLEAVETGISTVEKEFMAFVIMPDGRPLSDHVLPVLEKYAATGKMPTKFLALEP